MSNNFIDHYRDTSFTGRFRCVDGYIESHDEKMLESITPYQVGHEIMFEKKAVYEYIDGERRVYFDIENLNLSSLDDVDKFIVKLIEDFSDFYKLYDLSYIVTMNRKSRHPGVSLHIIFNIYVNNGRMLRNMVRLFVMYHPEYKGIIDVLVYNDVQYMRVPYSYNALKNIHYASEPLRFKRNQTNMNVRLVNLSGHASAAMQSTFENAIDQSERLRLPEGSRLVEDIDQSEGSRLPEAITRASTSKETMCSIPEPEVNEYLNEKIRRLISDIGINDPNDFHFIYSTTYEGYERSRFLISDTRDCHLYANKLPDINMPIDAKLREQKFGIRFEGETGSYGSYQDFI